MRIAADVSITKTRRMVLAAIAVMGFGLLQGARFIDVNSGPYSAHSLALFGLFVDGATLLTIAVLSYFGKIDDNRKLYCAGAISCALYLALSLLNLARRGHSSGIRRPHMVAQRTMLDGNLHQLQTTLCPYHDCACLRGECCRETTPRDIKPAGRRRTRRIHGNFNCPTRHLHSL